MYTLVKTSQILHFKGSIKQFSSLEEGQIMWIF